ncbi:uncharacterized protein B0H18DRAFT_491881 [Fomitopsis serialis]|uniref:uncharacterized protein n=1 Tax=Fomitopsis serialis TaxID=139415 RepID=UPI0020089D0B|nr:uncharacterized protein B0H18DRAFT_491881 [Neoantrodia serialis]KAH9934894.1 hypothetical protein B0H18DRAFT_491881 [Neoantrodia serialis]
MSVSATNKSLVYLALRLCVLLLSLAFNALLVGMSAMALSFGTGGGYEVISTILHVFAALLVFLRTIYIFRVEDQGSRGCLMMDGSIWSLSLMGCILLTIRAARNSGLVQDYSALTDARSVVAAVLTLAWLVFSLGASVAFHLLVLMLTAYLASFGITLDLLEPHRPARITPFVPYTSPPQRHRVVFHKNHRPLKIIEFQKDTNPYYWKQQATSTKEQQPRAPKPAYARPTQKQPVRMDVGWSMA